ncbi:MAG: glycerol-3-phosphate acyltransferase, partial [Steroidobacteraceae bacterium]|nr:glycerol-3-phosphate acyltransferase [Steroidobacteraceae bacterium]
AATTVGVVAALAPLLLLPAIGIWLTAIAVAGYVGLATMLAACALPIAAVAFGAAWYSARVVVLCAVALFIVYTHRSNIRRMLNGTEPRTRRLWLLGRGRT